VGVKVGVRHDVFPPGSGVSTESSRDGSPNRVNRFATKAGVVGAAGFTVRPSA